MTDRAAPRDPSPRDHIEVSVGKNFAGVSDRGRKHNDNQDAFELATVEILVSPIDVPPIYVAVVCDGVSSSESGSSASEIAAKTVMKSLEETLTRSPSANVTMGMRTAICLAHEAVCAMKHSAEMEKDPPATTVVAGVIQDGLATIGWIGDSRAYWVTDSDCGVLTRDDSWINAMIDAGRMTEEEALTAPNQSALFRCLGGLGEEDDKKIPAQPSFKTFRMNPGTKLILCSDGFWNYAPTPDDVAKLVRQTPHGNILKTAKHLVNFAIVEGGHDNITVVVLSQ